MLSQRRAVHHLFYARLSRRIVLWVFASIVLIEAIILLPSVYRRQQELLHYQRDRSAARVEGALSMTSPSPSDASLLDKLKQLVMSPTVLGGALYRANGQLVGSFGEPPTLSFATVQQNQTAEFYDWRQARYDAAWSLAPLVGSGYVLIVRHDAAPVQHELVAFIIRIAGLVMIIALFVTLATMVGLERTLITPIMLLRRDLLKAGEGIRKDDGPLQFDSLRSCRQDELGEVIAAFKQMYQQASDAIAERKQAESALRQSEEKFSRAFRASPNPILISRLSDGHLIEVNDSFLQLYQGRLEDVLGYTAVELDLWAKADDRNQMIQLLRQQGSLRNLEYTFRNKLGEPKTILFSAELIHLNGQECLVSVANDITERKQAEEALRESEARFRVLVEQAADAIFVTDTTGKILNANQQACDNLGYSRDELLALSIADIQKRLPEGEFARLQQQLAPGSPITYEGLHQRKDGTTFPVEVHFGLIEADERRLILGISRDITERKQAEKALARLAEIGELAAMIVHEVRNPLTTVLMGLNSFRRFDLSEAAQARLDLALEEANRLQRLLNEILLYARCQTLQFMELELNELLADMLDPIRSMPSAQGRQIEFKPAAVPVWILGDRDKLKQVFINLVSNACEAVAAGDIVTWMVEPHKASREVYVQIHNGGVPIPADELPNLTRLFYTTKSSGNGLGLAIVKRIIDAHEGVLVIESSEAIGGTTVSVQLPLATTTEN